MFSTSKLMFLLLLFALFGVSSEKAVKAPSVRDPEYTSDGQLRLPQDYRDWVWLTSDLHTASNPAKMQSGERRVFNNIFVNPEAYKAFVRTGKWPNKTMLIVEQRAAEEMGSSNPNQKGTDQGSVIGIAVHVKDEARFSGKWAFFGYQAGKTTAGMIPATAACYTCHASRGAVDTTFVQLYPTLLPAAKSWNTLSPAYLRDRGTLTSTTK